MIAEEISLGVDIEKLKGYILERISGLKITKQSQYYGGWSITSSNGDYSDGWSIDGYYKKENDKIIYDKELAKHKNVEHKVYDKPTSLYSGYLGEIMQKIESMGFSTRRARISRLEAGGSIPMHSDGTSDKYMVRLHIPVITNPGCFFVTEDGRVHMPANGNGFLVRVNKMHQIVNEGDQDRFHIIMNVWDTKKYLNTTNTTKPNNFA